MIVKCAVCNKYLDDEFRNTTCPHEAFLANDGQNKFSIYEEAWLSSEPPTSNAEAKGKYELWLEQNKLKEPLNEISYQSSLGETAGYQNYLNEQEIMINGGKQNGK